MMTMPLRLASLLLPISAIAAMLGDSGTSLLMRQLTVQSINADELLEDTSDLVSIKQPPPSSSDMSALWDTSGFASAQPSGVAMSETFDVASAQPSGEVNPNATGTGAALSYRPFTHDVFSRRPGDHVDLEFKLLRSADPSEWLVFVSTVAVLLFVEAFVLRHFSNRSFSQHALVLGFWVAMGLCYNGYFFVRYGGDQALDWFMGYLLEWLLSIDNLFVFHLVFKVYKTPQEMIPKALFFGVIGAIFFKLLFFLFIGELIHMAHVFQWFFGGLLVYSGIDAAMSTDQEDDEVVEDTYAVRIFRFCLGDRLCEKYEREEYRLFVVENGRTCATLLVLVVFSLECTDIVFAVDSVSAKVAQIPNQYIAYSSSVFAMFGLRAMFFIIKDLVDAFELLKYGICIILCFVGFQLILADWIDLSSTTVCFVILSVFTICIAGSMVSKRWQSTTADSAQTAKEVGA